MADRDVKLRLLIQAVDRAGKTLSEVSQKLGGISTKTEKANADAKRLGTEGARALNKYADAAKKAEARMDALRKASSAMVGVGMQLAAAGAALSGLAIFPIAKAASFEKAMSGVKAVTTGATESFEEMSVKARELGRTTKFTATEAAEGMKLLGMAGLTAKETIEGIGPALQLAAAGGLGLAEAADIATNVMSGFAMEAKDVAHIADVLANSASSANTTVTELGEAMSYVAPLSKAAGVSMDQTAAILSVLGDNGIKASRAGTSLRGMLIALAAPTKQSEDTFAALGVEIAKLADGGIDVVTTLERLKEANFNVADATNIFRRTAAAAALAAASNTDKIRKLTEANKTAEGKAKEMAETMMKNLVGSLVELKSAIEGAAIAMGGPLLKSITSVSKKIATVVRAFAKWSEENKKLSGFLTASVGILGALLLVLGAVFLSVGLGIKAFISLATAWTAVILPIKSSAIALKAYTVAANLANLSTKALAGSVAVVAAAFAALGFTLYKTWRAFITWKEAQLDADISARSLQNNLQRVQITVRKFNKETGESAKTIQDVTKLMREEGYVLDKQTKLWRKLTEEERKNKEVKKPPPVALVDPELTKKQVEFELQTQSLRVQVMKEGVDKINKLRALELKQLEQSGAASVATSAMYAEREAVINAQYDKAVTDFKKSELDKRLAIAQQASVAELQLAETATRNQVEALNRQYEAGVMPLEDYFDARRNLLEDKFESEIEMIYNKIKQAQAEGKSTIILETELKIKEEERRGAITGVEAEKTLEYNRRLKAEQDFQIELLEIQQAQLVSTDVAEAKRLEVEITELTNQQILNSLRQRGIEEVDIARWKTEQQELLTTRLAEMDKQAVMTIANTRAEAFSRMGQAFDDLYTASAEKVKAFFYLQRAAAIAETIMRTHAEVALVGSQTGVFGIPMKALVLAQGMARVAMIAAQAIRGFAEGGLVKGKKGKDKNIIAVTDNEYVMNPKAVGHYGLQVMEAINRRVIDLKRLGIPKLSVTRPAYAFASGGSTRDTGGGGRESEGQAMNIINVLDPALMDQYVSTTHGQRNILNVMSQNAFAVRQILASEG